MIEYQGLITNYIIVIIVVTKNYQISVKKEHINNY